MAFADCIKICAHGQNPNQLQWLGPPGSCLDSTCNSNQFCGFEEEFENPKYGWCKECPGTTAEDCQTALAHYYSWQGYDFDDCVKVCAGGQNPNGIKHIPNST